MNMRNTSPGSAIRKVMRLSRLPRAKEKTILFGLDTEIPAGN